MNDSTEDLLQYHNIICGAKFPELNIKYQIGLREVLVRNCGP